MALHIIIFIISILSSPSLYAMERVPDDDASQFSDKQKEKLFTYIHRGWDNFFRRELDKGFPLETRDKFGYTLLQAACSGSNFDIVSLLIARGANVHAQTHHVNMSPLRCAITSNPDAPKIVETLLIHGADASAQGYENTTPLFLAAAGGYSNLVFIILTKARFFTDYTIYEDDDMEEAVRLFTDFRCMEGKKLLIMKDKHTLTPLAIMKMNLQIICKRTELKKHEIERKRGFAELIPLLTIELFEENYRGAIQDDVRKILMSSRKKRL